ncbi:MAG: hypothetical protein GTO18_16070 [Anaerolineales bacterium]|nr:hypothetical protein [Anaerolineales bacterium]
MSFSRVRNIAVILLAHAFVVGSIPASAAINSERALLQSGLSSSEDLKSNNAATPSTAYTFSTSDCRMNDASNDCNELRDAFEQLSAGDTLIIHQGVYYNPWLTFDSTSGKINGRGEPGNPITIRNYPGEEVVFKGKTLGFRDTSYWMIEGITFDYMSGKMSTSLGLHTALGQSQTIETSNITIRNSSFINCSAPPIHINYARDILIEDNHFENCRKRSVGSDLSAIDIKYIGHDITIIGNTFNDIGSDPVHLGAQSYKSGTNIYNIYILNNEFRVLRPYQYRDTSGNVPPGDETKFSNVGENAIDIKKVCPNGGEIVVRGNTMHGFRPTARDQDVSGDSSGAAIVIHNDARNVIVEQNRIFDSTGGIVVAKGSDGTENWQDAGVDNITIRNNLISDIVSFPGYEPDQYHAREGRVLKIGRIKGAKVYNNTFVNNPDAKVMYMYSFSYGGSSYLAVINLQIKNNVLDSGRFDIGSNNAGYPGQVVEIDHNAFAQINGSIPSLFQGDGSIYDDNLLLDQTNFIPLPESPLIDAGTDLGNQGVINDFNNTARPQGPGYDIGAFEAPTSDLVFADVPLNHWAHDFIVSLFEAGYTSGCSEVPERRFCPEETMNRAESAVFVVRGLHSETLGYIPPSPNVQVFDDVPIGDSEEWFSKWVTELSNQAYTAGCSDEPPLYCPMGGHNRAEATVFYLRMLYGSNYRPPDPVEQIFIDVPLVDEDDQSVWYAKWVNAAFDVELIQPCQTDMEAMRFRPEDPLTRSEAACMMYQSIMGILNPPPQVS